jgi:hypothetical protein
VNRSSTRRVCIIVLLSLVSILLHELGHYTVYNLANIPVHVTFQSVRPIAPISGPVAELGQVAGPAFIDLLRVFQGGTPFSDEGDFALALTHSPITRSLVVLSFFTIAAILTALAARRYHFQKYGTLKVVGIYLFSLGIGIGVLIVDGLLHPASMQK